MTATQTTTKAPRSNSRANKAAQRAAAKTMEAVANGITDPTPADAAETDAQAEQVQAGDAADQPERTEDEIEAANLAAEDRALAERTAEPTPEVSGDDATPEPEPEPAADAKPVLFTVSVPADLVTAFTAEVDGNWPQVTLTAKPAKTPKAPKTAAPGGPCACGCGQTTQRAQATFVRGHDSTLGKALRAAYADGSSTAEEVLAKAATISERFTGKITRGIAAIDAERAATAQAEQARNAQASK